MLVPITVIARTRPTARLFGHVRGQHTVLITDRATALLDGAEQLAASGRVTSAEPDVYYRSPGCDCCAVREDLVASIVRATRRNDPPERIVVIVDLDEEDLLIAVSTILSSIEISRRSTLDAVVVHVDAVELSTRLATGGELVDGRLVAALAIADRVVLDGHDQVTASVRDRIHAALNAHTGFARVVDGDEHATRSCEGLDAWHGAPAARSVEADRAEHPSTVVMRVDQPLDADAIDEWLDLLVARHASRLLRLQGALSVQGNDERTCCFGVLSFAMSHSEREHETRRSTESVLAVCGIGLDADALTAGFRSTVAT